MFESPIIDLLVDLIGRSDCMSRPSSWLGIGVVPKANDFMLQLPIIVYKSRELAFNNA
jgi:hypothetical protein